MYGGNAKGPDSGDVTPFPYSMLVKVDDSDHRALEQDSRFYYPAYMGPSGWLVAPKKLIKEPDSR
jgi:hypothetical protein